MNKKDMKTLANKVIVITGASSGIGEAMAKVYAAQGAKVVLGARNVQKLQLLAGDIRARGGQAAYCGVDVTKPEECRELIETAVREFGGIDVLICNAGISMRAIFDDVDLGVLHRLMDVNFWGTVNCCKFALPYLQASKGSVVGISSVAGLHGLPGRTAFSLYRFSRRDRLLLLWLTLCGAYVAAGWALGGVKWRYYPTARGVLTPYSASVLLAYFLLCLTPVLLQRKEARTWSSIASKAWPLPTPGSSRPPCGM